MFLDYGHQRWMVWTPTKCFVFLVLEVGNNRVERYFVSMCKVLRTRLIVDSSSQADVNTKKAPYDQKSKPFPTLLQKSVRTTQRSSSRLPCSPPCPVPCVKHSENVVERSVPWMQKSPTNETLSRHAYCVSFLCSVSVDPEHVVCCPNSQARLDE